MGWTIRPAGLAALCRLHDINTGVIYGTRNIVVDAWSTHSRHFAAGDVFASLIARSWTSAD
jgi:hypothetical protein